MSPTSKVIILGANGRFGRAAAQHFQLAGWDVALAVRPGSSISAKGAKVIEVDASDPDALTRACAGNAVIVNALNPPYPAWKVEMPKLTHAVITAARKSGARVMIPGNVYNFGPNLPSILNADTPQQSGGKGGLRIEMERQFRNSGVPTIILRGGDFIEGEKTGNWFDSVITNKVAKGHITYPGPTNIAHAWAYLPDMARAAVMLCSRSNDLPVFADIPFPGYTLTGQQLGDLISASLGKTVKIKPLPWWVLGVAGLVSPLMREVHEMRYLWQRPHQLDGAAIQAILPDFVATPQAVGIATALSVSENQAVANALVSAT
jgi:nucleoside-diphosphate-sugar epimerase